MHEKQKRENDDELLCSQNKVIHSKLLHVFVLHYIIKFLWVPSAAESSPLPLRCASVPPDNPENGGCRKEAL